MPAIERSVSGRRWRWRDHDQALALAISQRGDLPEILGRVLAGRGLTPDGVDAFILPRVRDLLPDPSHLLDLDRAAERLADAVEAGERIGLLADYDVDGATSAALLARYLSAVGVLWSIDVPDRLREGYGPSPAALERLSSQGCGLLVTLDSGSTAFDALSFAAERNLEVIVVDHHSAEERLPPSLAVVNPNRRDQVSPAVDLAAVGVTFLLVVALNRLLRERGFFESRLEPDLRQWLDLVALGTVCDLVPLTGLNRALVAQGLRVAAKRLNPGLAALAATARLDVASSAEHFGFVLGPRLNAGGRTGRSELAVLLLTSDAPELVREIALRLDHLNEERRVLERQALSAAESQLTEALSRDAPLLLAAGEGWSPGVVGLVASRLVERYHRPAVVIGLQDGVGKGSGRSIRGFDLGGAVIAARRAGLLLAGGGHPMAAGLTVAAGKLGDLTSFLDERLAGSLGTGAPTPPDLDLDGTLQVGGVSLDLAGRLDRLAPFGRGNPEPRFMLPQARAFAASATRGGHVACRLQDAAGGRVRAIAFRALERPLGKALLESPGTPLHLAGRVRLERWQDRLQVAFQIDDAAIVP